MADFVFVRAKGAAAELARNVDTGSPANSRLLVVPITTTETDGNLQDLDTLAAVLGNANTSELTASGWERKTLTAADVTVTVDDANDRVDVDIPDQTWTAVRVTTRLIC